MFRLFAGHNYYPQGGMLDYMMSGTLEECKEYFVINANTIAHGNYIDNWCHIVSEELEIVLYGRHDENGVQWGNNYDLLYD